MAGARTRSEYRAALASLPPREHVVVPEGSFRPVEDRDRAALAVVLLDAYRGTIDDEGETEVEARAAIDYYLRCLIREHSVVVSDADSLIAMSFVVVVGTTHYIDPVATASSRKGRGFGRAAVEASLGSLSAAGVGEVGAVITDGNTASQRLFEGLGFERVGVWG